MRWTVLVFLICTCGIANAGVRSKGLSEALEFVGKKFGREVAEEGAERLSARMTQLAANHGDEVVGKALTKVGPRAGQVATDAGEHAGVALKVLADHGNEALAVVTRPPSLRAIAQHGDTAANALIKHGSVAEPIIDRFALPGAEALVKVTPQNGRRIAMMAAKDEMNPELMGVIIKHGDAACDFIFRNKKALAVGATLTAFVSDPSGFLDGTQKLAGVVAESVVKPVAEIPRTVAGEIARNTNWTLLALAGAGIATFIWWARRGLIEVVPHLLSRR